MWPWEQNFAKWVNGQCDRFVEGVQHAERINKDLRAKWLVWAGDLANHMLSDRELTIQTLSHNIPAFRRCAISILVHHWNVRAGEDGANDIFRLATNEPDPETRIIAVRSLEICFQKTDDVEVGRALALIVRDEQQSSLLRMWAYYALFGVRGLRVRRLSASRPPKEIADLVPLLKEIDWPFVDSFLLNGRLSAPSDPVAEKVPEHLRPFMNCYISAYEAYHHGKYQEAAMLFSKAAELHSGIPLPQVYFLRGKAFLQIGRLEEAISDFTTVIKMWPDCVLAYEDRSRAYMNKGAIAKAMADEKVAAGLRSQKKI
jgi:hypothetical protein